MVTQNTSFTGSHIYRQDHILGLVEGELSAELYRNWGYALGQIVSAGSVIIVSADIRESSKPFKAALIEGLLSSDIHVIDVGFLPTDLASYARDTFSAAGFVCVSGDWHSSRWNGLRWQFSDTDSSVDEQVLRLCDFASNSPVIDTVAAHRSMPNHFRKYDITFHWISWAQDVWYDANQRSMRILLDPMHGSWSQIASRALQAIFPHVFIETTRDTPNDKFGGVIPNSQIVASIAPTCKAARKQHIDFGIILGADAGNFTIIDNEGEPLSVEETQWLFIRHLLCDAFEGEILLHDCMCSEVLLNEAIRLGAKPKVSKLSPECFIKDMRQMNAILGIMSDGSLYFRGTGGYRIVVFAISWLIDYMLCATFKLSDWRKTLPTFNITPELRVNSAQIDEVVKHLSEEWSSKPVKTIDGYNFSGTAARVHIRLIGGYDQLGFRFESKSRDGLDNIVKKCCIALSKFGDIASSISGQYKETFPLNHINNNNNN
ncbi:MAG: hypothetical protein LBC74_03010 [Planctomycetaceae bacterium]|jgi:phosphomannomutase|nr:hypothetical protein [Planctomycetaceae bacterium]